MGLQAAGHHVRVATHADFASFIRGHGLDFFPIEASGRGLQTSATGNRMQAAGSNPFVFMREFVRLRQPLVAALMERCHEACADTDLILLSPTALFVSLSVAEKLRLPTCWTALQPATPTRYLANFFFPSAPEWLPGRSLYTLLTHWVAGETLWQLMRTTLNRARREVLGLPPLPLPGPIAAMLRPEPRLYGFSPRVVLYPPDWGPHHHITGYWFLDETDYQPPVDLADFLHAGPPPVYVGFGSSSDRDADEVTRMVLQALESTGQRGVLATGWGALERVSRSERIFPVGSVPHAWLFPRMAAVIHHGGAGTTGAALRSGVPSLVVPFTSDQPFWGRRTFDLGVGPPSILRKELTAERLADAIRTSLHDSNMRQRAAVLGTQIQAEDGVTRAVEVFERYVARSRPVLRGSMSAALGPTRRTPSSLIPVP
jgi:UDP:flavonoid glycosyltransferase YjiC (YdhE family)